MNDEVNIGQNSQNQQVEADQTQRDDQVADGVNDLGIGGAINDGTEINGGDEMQTQNVPKTPHVTTTGHVGSPTVAADHSTSTGNEFVSQLTFPEIPTEYIDACSIEALTLLLNNNDITEEAVSSTAADILSEQSDTLTSDAAPDIPTSIAAEIAADSSSASDASLQEKPKRVRRPCSVFNCTRRSRSIGLCIAHGGGKRCEVEGCNRSSQSGNLCIRHGGGRRCRVVGCQKAAQTNSLCKAHGGGPRCQFPDCDKSAQGSGFCRVHGGGRRCAVVGCTKGTQRGAFCALHGGYRLCSVEGCSRNDRGGGLCGHHGGGRRCSEAGCDRPCRRNGLCTTHARLAEIEANNAVDNVDGSSSKE